MSPVDRRRFLTGSLAALGAGGAGVARRAGRRPAGPRRGPPPDPATAGARGRRRASCSRRVPFDGPHQSGILTPSQARLRSSPWTASPPTPTELFEALQAHLHRGPRCSPRASPSGSPSRRPAAGLRNPRRLRQPRLADGDGRARGLAVRRRATDWPRKRPRRLTPMPAFALDEIDPDADRRRRAAADLCRPARHGRPHRPRADARARRPRWPCAGRSTASRPRKRGPHREQQHAQPVRLPRRHGQPRRRPTPR